MGGQDHGRLGTGVQSNARLTGPTAAVLLVLLAVEGATVPRVHALLRLHVFVWMLLVPPVLLKIGSTAWVPSTARPSRAGLSATLPSCRLISMRLPSLKEDQGLPAFEGSEETLAREILGATKRGPWSQACNTPPFRPLMQSSRRRQEGGRPARNHWRC